MSLFAVLKIDLNMQKEIKDIDLEDASTLDKEVEHPIYPAQVKITRDQFPLLQLKRKAEPMRNELIIDPDFQRLFVWNIKQKSELIESILMGIPLPVIYLFEQNDGRLQVVDGRQRLTAIFQYMNNEFSLFSELKILKGERGKKFKDLSFLMQGKIEDFQMTIYRIQPPTPEKVKFDIFDRVNRGGVKLNHQEMRNALHQGKVTILLKQLAESDVFQKAIGYSVKSERMKDRYIILRYLSFYMHYQKWPELVKLEYKSDIDDFLGEIMDLINLFSDEKIEKLKSVFFLSMENSYSVMNEDAFRFKNSTGKKLPINMALFESFAYFFSNENIDYNAKKKEIFERLEMQKDSFYKSDFSRQVDSSTRVNERFYAMIALQKEFEND